MTRSVLLSDADHLVDSKLTSTSCLATEEA